MSSIEKIRTSLRRGKPLLKLRGLITLLVCLVMALVLLPVTLLFAERVEHETEKGLEEKAMSIARTLAHTPLIIEQLQQTGSSPSMQEYVKKVSTANHIQFVVVMDMKGIRKTHPDARKIGKAFVGGDEYTALHGQESVSVAKGTLGMSMRAFSPVFSVTGKQVGAIVVGISMQDVQRAQEGNTRLIAIAIGIGMLIGTGGAVVLARKIKNMLVGLEPPEIARLLEERSAMLQSIKEGVIAVDECGRIMLMNAEAIRLLRQAGIEDFSFSGQEITVYLSAFRLQEVLEVSTPLMDEEMELGGITLLTTSVPIRVKGKIVGAIVTFRDKTEMKQLAERLTGVSLYTEALRAQAHEFMNKLHVIMGMVHLRMYDKLEHYIMDAVEHHQVEIGSITRQLKDPVMAGFVLGKLSRAREAGVNFELTPGSYLPESSQTQTTHELITILGNLFDNAVEAMESLEHKRITLSLYYEENQKNGCLTCIMCDNGPGIPEGLGKAIFEKGFSTKGESRGMGLYLVSQSVKRLQGSVKLIPVEQGCCFQIKIPYIIAGNDEHD
ncbi:MULTISPECIES: DcuS/MalK family sensor histidine kinase [Paenibacillus]|uniref:DcuS/MalK family sensor histidine kinase n=1 Tax=Paenibacillus TaxID=44249 RepID=UPI0008AB14BB|nr:MULTISPECIES: DcuS/MalK family sensor histidine kinase [Paenibacillus]MDU8672137.1 DcuS/MalK family sensor histidine kinase [Paenibacillus polymyxa]MDU8697046.1 DcuS/MalK family sensor histidine kinase [Paenibacillus polymyxa]UNL93151.1 two-component system sensor histidine kinase DcuS [Paenibacillus polymyxa]UQQ33843.1 DcuS/MalK family sensor histidine kinase [Paenibacillus polymyxa]URJ56231.3 DcuS/MalK family sensor histidine kinase [Paenibacillus polymyxa]